MTNKLMLAKVGQIFKWTKHPDKKQYWTSEQGDN